MVLLIAIGGAVFRRTTRAGVLAAATAKEAIRQPMLLLSGALAVAVLVVNTFLPFFSLGEDVKMLKDCGLATMLIVGLLVAVWTASTTIHDEIEGRTAMTLLSKPINRRQFVLGKYLGILQAVGLLTVVVGAIFLGLVFYKIIYDAQESEERCDRHRVGAGGDAGRGLGCRGCPGRRSACRRSEGGRSNAFKMRPRPAAGLPGDRGADGDQRGD